MQELESIYKGNQRLAIESTDINTCVSAGAGTGKTFVLVRRFIQLLKENKAGVSEIAAITFTEKAAKEMKDRIRASCCEKHKRDLESARIGTIHAFCARLLRENPIEAGIDPRFRVLDEPESISITDKIVHKEILNLLDKEEPDIVFILSEYGFKSTKNIIKSLIKERIDTEKCVSEFMHISDQQIIEYWQDIDRKKKEELIGAITKSPEWIKIIQILTEYSALNSSDILEERRRKIIDLNQKDALSIDEKSAILLEIRKQCIKTGHRKNNWDSSSLKAVSEAITILRGILDPNIKYLETTSEELDLKGVEITRRVFRLYEKIKNVYTAYKKTDGFLDFNDLIIDSKKLLKENKYIRKLYQNSIKYLLVDEYQDTDFHQKEIIFYLTEETSMTTSDNIENMILSKDKLFIVGDHKQSIYRFRGADVSVFEDTRRIFQKAGRNIDLDVSLRTNPQNVSFLNDFFGKIMGRERTGKQDYEADYTDVTSCRNIKTEEPQLEFIVVNEEELSAPERRKKEAELIARRIKQMVQKREKLVYEKKASSEPEAPREVQYKDIAILFRAMTNISIYEQAFRKLGIPYYILSGSGFFGRQEIKDILNYLKVLDNSRDDIALAGVLRSPMVGINDDALYQLRRHNSSLLDAVRNNKDNEKLILFGQIFDKLKKIKNRISINALIEEIIKQTDYYSILITQFMGTQKVSNIKKLIDTARKFEEKGIFALADFIKYMNEFVINDVREGEAAIVSEESNVIKIMTIHKAKGLEFPIVIIPDISKTPYISWNHFLYDREFIGIGLQVKDASGELQDTIQRKWINYEDTRKELAEGKRLLYVASTRAKDYLIYSGKLVSRKSGARTSHIWSGWFLDHYNFDKLENGLIKLTEKVKARITTEIPYFEERKRLIPLVEQFSREIRNYKELPYPSNSTYTDKILKQIDPITKFHSLKDRYTVTEFSTYLKCPRRYELNHIMGIPEFQPYRDSSKLPAALLGTITHKFFEKWDLSEKGISPLIDEIKEKDCVDPILYFVEKFKKNPIYKELKESTEIKRELAITFRHNSYIIEGVIDKLYKARTGWVILDYKTDNITEKEIPEKAKFYEIQLGIYSLGINTIFNIKPEKLVISFLAPGKTHTIKCNEDYIQNIEQKLTTLISNIEKSQFNPISTTPDKCNCSYKHLCQQQ